MLPLSRMAAVLSVLLFMCNLTALAQQDDLMTSSPLRLSYVEGEVSFWRPGAPDWVEAQLNTPLSVGDALYIGENGDLELQLGNRAFIRADDDTQLTLINQTSDFTQFKVATGRVSFDLRALPSGYSMEVDTPNAVFTIDHAGYYRVDVDGEVHFITRRGGQAMMVPSGGRAMSIHPSEEIVVQGSTLAQAETYVVPELDRWDRWNYDRTDDLIDTVSERYLPYGIAGASDLDHYGSWRVTTEYGPVWVPEAVTPDWAPYSIGRWGWDPYYQWTWIDDEPWGWAPFHYGRWVYLSGYWAWAPGPVIRRPVYSPALVAFFNVGPNVSVGISTPGVGWVALSWGEPVNPWWGRRGFIGRPWWGGWGGPRIVNNVYYNTRVLHSVVATTHEHFGRGHVHDAPVRVTQPRELDHIHGALPVRPGPTSLVAGALMGIRPPENLMSRPVVGTRPPGASKLPWRDKISQPVTEADPEQHLVQTPRRQSNGLPRPEFGVQTGEERQRPHLPPRFEDRKREAEPAATGIMAPESRMKVAEPSAARATARREIRQREQVERENLPGRSANRVYRFKDKDKERDERRRSKQKSD